MTGGKAVYAIVLDWPDKDTLTLGAPVPTPGTSVSMLGYSGIISWSKAPQGGMVIQMPVVSINELPSPDAWVFKLTKLQN